LRDLRATIVQVTVPVQLSCSVYYGLQFNTSVRFLIIARLLIALIMRILWSVPLLQFIFYHGVLIYGQLTDPSTVQMGDEVW
jgi:hypothetical protein